MTRLGRGKAGAQLESEFDPTIAAMADVLGWLCAHHPDSRRLIGHAGMPDWTFLHRETGRMLFVETKTPTGTLTSGQHEWLQTMVRGGHDAHLLILPRDLSVLEGLLRG